jgi:hypothetical protein
MKETLTTIFKAVALAIGVAVIVLSILKTLSPSAGMLMLGLGVAALGIASFKN